MTKEFDERNAAKSRSVCERMAEAASTGKRALTQRERQILDMWPKYEDGEYVWFGDAYIDADGDATEVRGIEFEEGCTDLVGIESFHTAFWAGERVKRPAPKVLDADGVEIGMGDVVWIKADGSEAAVKGFADFDGSLFVLLDCPTRPNVLGSIPDGLTHTRPDSWERLEEDVNAIATGDGMHHRLNGYCNAHGLSGDDVIALTVCDLVRRAKALAGAEAGR